MKLQINWIYVFSVIIISTLGLGYISLQITRNVYLQWVQGLPFSNGWSWPTVIVFDLFDGFAWVDLEVVQRCPYANRR